MLVLCLFMILIKNLLLLTEATSRSGSHVSSSYDDNLIYEGTSISPFFDDGASSSLLSPPLRLKLSKEAKQSISETMQKGFTEKNILESSDHNTHNKKLESNSKLKPVSNPRKWVRTEEYKARLRQLRTGKKHSQATKAKMSKSHRGKRMSEETKQKLSKSMHRFFDKKEAAKEQSQQHFPSSKSSSTKK
jgi:NUMOD3 motif